MQAPDWLRKHVITFFLAFAVVYLMVATAYFMLAFFDDGRVNPQEAVGLLLIGLIFILLTLARIRSTGSRDQGNVGDLPTSVIPRIQMPFASARHRFPPATYNANPSVQRPTTPPRGGKPSEDEVVGFMRGVMAGKESTGDYPPVPGPGKEAP